MLPPGARLLLASLSGATSSWSSGLSAHVLSAPKTERNVQPQTQQRRHRVRFTWYQLWPPKNSAQGEEGKMEGEYLIAGKWRRGRCRGLSKFLDPGPSFDCVMRKRLDKLELPPSVARSCTRPCTVESRESCAYFRGHDSSERERVIADCAKITLCCKMRSRCSICGMNFVMAADPKVLVTVWQVLLVHFICIHICNERSSDFVGLCSQLLLACHNNNKWMTEWLIIWLCRLDRIFLDSTHTQWTKWRTMWKTKCFSHYLAQNFPLATEIALFVRSTWTNIETRLWAHPGSGKGGQWDAYTDRQWDGELNKVRSTRTRLHCCSCSCSCYCCCCVISSTFPLGTRRSHVVARWTRPDNARGALRRAAIK